MHRRAVCAVEGNEGIMIGKHSCEKMPDDSGISFSRFFPPTLTVGSDDCETPFHFDKQVYFCPWCASDLRKERAEWLEMIPEDITF